MLMTLVLAVPRAYAQPPDTANPPNLVVTSGEAVVRHAPDRAFLTVTVEARAKNPRDAQRQNAEAMTAVQQRLTLARVSKDAVRTLGYDLEQEFDFLQGRRVPREFVARNAIEVRVDEIARVGELLDVAVQAARRRSAAFASTFRTARRSSGTPCGSRSSTRGAAPKQPPLERDARSTASSRLKTRAAAASWPSHGR